MIFLVIFISGQCFKISSVCYFLFDKHIIDFLYFYFCAPRSPNQNWILIMLLTSYVNIDMLIFKAFIDSLYKIL